MIFSIVKIMVVFAVVMTGVSYSVYAERKISAFIQDRIGPNRVGPFGLFQPAADGVKAFLKEDFTPGHVRKIYFWLAPMITMIPALLVLGGDSIRFQHGRAENGHCRFERGHTLHVRHRFAGRLWNRAGGVRVQFEISIPRRNSFQRADDFLRNCHGHVGHSRFL